MDPRLLQASLCWSFSVREMRYGEDQGEGVVNESEGVLFTVVVRLMVLRILV